MKNCFEMCFGDGAFIYYAERGDTFFTLQEKFLLPAEKIMRDNAHLKKIEEGRAVYIDRNTGATSVLLPETDGADIIKLKEKNPEGVFYPFRRVFI